MKTLTFPGGSVVVSSFGSAPYVAGKHPTTIGTRKRPSVFDGPRYQPGQRVKLIAKLGDMVGTVAMRGNNSNELLVDWDNGTDGWTTDDCCELVSK